MTAIQDIMITEMCRRSWDQAELAQAVDSSPMEVNFWLKSHNPTVPPLDTCTAIAIAFDLDPQQTRQSAGYP
jgi:hypothetical protein